MIASTQAIALWGLGIATVTACATAAPVLWSLRQAKAQVTHGQRRLHDAVFGYTEGGTHVKGVYEVTVGNGKGSILDVALDAKTVAEAARNEATAARIAAEKAAETVIEKLAENASLLSEHIASDALALAKLHGSIDIVASALAAATQDALRDKGSLQTEVAALGQQAADGGRRRTDDEQGETPR